MVRLKKYLRREVAIFSSFVAGNPGGACFDLLWSFPFIIVSYMFSAISLF